jgi:hypothetical protein
MIVNLEDTACSVVQNPFGKDFLGDWQCSVSLRKIIIAFEVQELQTNRLIGHMKLKDKQVKQAGGDMWG